MIMKVYVLITEDRHIDVLVDLFKNKDRAIKTAETRAKEYAKAYHSEVETEKIEGWVYYAKYSLDGDCVRVVERPLIEGEER
jgi:hypothetical protein